MANDIEVEPLAAAPELAPAPEAEAAPMEGDQGGGLPDELNRIPVIQGILAGAPPAVSAPIVEFSQRPEAQLIKSHLPILQSHGMSLYRSLDGNIGVLFNQLKLSGDQLKQADQGGKLLELAPPWDEVNASVGQSGGGNPVLAAGAPTGPPNMPPTPPQMAQAPMSGGKPPSAAVEKKIATARLSNAQPGAPTSGPKPGAGRLVNNILKPVV